jgi:hypothetical protein
MAAYCSRCNKVLNCSADEPCVAASSLGPGTYHLDCARAEWVDIAREEVDRKSGISAKRSEIMLARPRSCASCGETVIGSVECSACIVSRQEAEEYELE